MELYGVPDSITKLNKQGGSAPKLGDLAMRCRNVKEIEVSEAESESLRCNLHIEARLCITLP